MPLRALAMVPLALLVLTAPTWAGTPPPAAAPQDARPPCPAPGAESSKEDILRCQTQPSDILEPAIDEGPGRPWSASFGVGLSIWLLDEAPLGQQLLAAGYDIETIGWSFEFSVDRFVLDWLVVGAEVDLKAHLGARDLNMPKVRDSADPSTSSSLWRVTGSAYVQPTLCLEYGSCDREGMMMALQLALGVGPTLWALRDEVEAAPHVIGTASLIWNFWGGAWGMSMRISHGLMWQGGLGPRDVGHGFEWTPGVSVRLMHRW